jgi:hypothetical protein
MTNRACILLSSERYIFFTASISPKQLFRIFNEYKWLYIRIDEPRCNAFSSLYFYELKHYRKLIDANLYNRLNTWDTRKGAWLIRVFNSL